MDIINPNHKIPMLATDGIIKEMPLYLKDELIKSGWLIVSPDVAEKYRKEGITYLPNFDQTIAKRPITPTDYSVLDPNKESNVLEVDIL